MELGLGHRQPGSRRHPLLPGFLTCVRQDRQNKACQKHQTGCFMQCVYGRNECKHKFRNMRGCSEQLKWWVGILKAVYRVVNQGAREGSVWLAVFLASAVWPHPSSVHHEAASLHSIFSSSSPSQAILLPHQNCRAHRDERTRQGHRTLGELSYRHAFICKLSIYKTCCEGRPRR